MPNTKFNAMYESSILLNTTDVQTTPVVPNGKTAVVTEFGGSCPDASCFFALQWGAGATWETVRASYGNQNWTSKKMFKGNGVKRFRVVRKNASLSLAQVIFAWLDGYIKDA